MARLNHKRGRKSNYLKSLNNEKHRLLREKVLIRDRFQCKEVGCNSRIRLETHHITYYLKGESILGKELEDDNMKWCVCVCEFHHSEIHKNLNHIWNPKNVLKQPI